jgi:SET domain-containing protein
MTRNDLIEVRQVPGKGRGVVALVDIPEGTVVEVSPAQVLPRAEAEAIETHAPSAAQHLFWWDDEGREALVFGVGTMFNHAADGCLRLDRDHDAETVTFTTTRPVHAGEELCYDYGCTLWFVPA